MKRNVFTAAGIVLLAIYWYLVLAVTGGTPTNFLIIKDFSVSADLSLVPFRDLLAILGGNDFGGSFLQIGGNVILFAPPGLSRSLFLAGLARRRPHHCPGLCDVAVYRDQSAV